MTERDEIALRFDRLMRRITSGISRRHEELDRFGTGPLGGLIVLTLADLEPCPVHRLVDRLARDKSQMTRMIKVLERKNLVVRQPSPSDGRVVLLALSDRGRQLLRAIRAVMTDVVGETLHPLDDGERAVLLNILRKVGDG